MKNVIYLAIAALAISISAAPTPEAGRTYISYGALGADRAPSNGGASTPANPYVNTCHEGERCWRDTGKRSSSGTEHTAAAEVEQRSAEAGRTYISYGAIAGDGQARGPATPANPYKNICHEGERCWRDTGKRAELDSEVEESSE